MRRRTPAIAMTMVDAFGSTSIRRRLEFVVGLAPRWSRHRDVFWDGYAHYLAMYAGVRDDLRAIPRRPPRRPLRAYRDHVPFAEVLFRAARRWPTRDVDLLGAELWTRRYGTEATCA